MTLGEHESSADPVCEAKTNAVHPTPALPAVEYGERSDPGRDPNKQVNEDACGRRETRFGHLCVVCDGMGGHAAGREAAQLALASIFQVFDEAVEDTPPDRVLRHAIEEASRRVFRTYSGAIRHPGSTVVAVLMHARGTEVAHVGDSRAYVVQGEEIHRLTRDHSFVQELVDCGLVPEDKAVQHPVANRITRALGTAAEVEVELRAQPVRYAPSDAFVLCSDGLSDLVDDKEILAIVGSEPAAQAVSTLIDLANARGGHDNVTVVLLRAREAAVVEPRVWRLDCEVHALGDERVEVVDKGSSTALRLNGSSLRRGTVEPGGVVELGDVRFKLVSSKKVGRRRASRMLPPVVLALVALAGAVGVSVYSSRPRPAEPLVSEPVAAAVSPDSPDERALDHRLLSLDDIASAFAGSISTSPPAGPTSATAGAIATTSKPSARPPVAPVATNSSIPPSRIPPADPDDKERARPAMTLGAKRAYQAQLEQKVYGGRATDAEIEQLIATCSELGDKRCLQQARAIKTQRDLVPLDRTHGVGIQGY
jgi:serine/threonine protein phosphatase PrpC